MPHCRHITQVSKIQPQTISINIHSHIFFLLPMSFENHRVQEDSTATLSCTMTGTVNDPASFRLTHKGEGTLVLLSNHPSSSSSTMSTSVHYSLLQNPPPSPIQDLLAIPVKN